MVSKKTDHCQDRNKWCWGQSTADSMIKDWWKLTFLYFLYSATNTEFISFLVHSSSASWLQQTKLTIASYKSCKCRFRDSRTHDRHLLSWMEILESTLFSCSRENSKEIQGWNQPWMSQRMLLKKIQYSPQWPGNLRPVWDFVVLLKSIWIIQTFCALVFNYSNFG